jgi:hypothetical protein
MLKKLPFSGCGRNGSVIILRLAAPKGLQMFLAHSGSYFRTLKNTKNLPTNNGCFGNVFFAVNNRRCSGRCFVYVAPNLPRCHIAFFDDNGRLALVITVWVCRLTHYAAFITFFAARKG